MSLPDHGSDIDLIVATVGRPEELKAFLDSVVAQDGVRARVVVADQSDDDCLAPTLQAYRPGLPDLIHLRSRGGVSAARNDGQARATARIVAWPDDDCAYPAGLLTRVVGAFAADDALDVLVGRVQDPSGALPLVSSSSVGGVLDRDSVWRHANANVLFSRRTAAESVGEWNTQLGPGAGTRWGAGEDSEWLVRAVRAGLRVRFDPELTVLHRDPFVVASADARERARRYGRCTSAVALSTGYGMRFVARLVARAAGGAAVAAARRRPGQARMHVQAFIGRIEGAAAYLRDGGLQA